MKNFFIIFSLTFLLSIQSALAVTTEKNEEHSAASSSPSFTAAEKKATNWFLSTKASLEEFRLKQATHFGDLRDSTKLKLGISVESDVWQNLGPLLNPPPAPDPMQDPQAQGVESKKMDNPMDYGMLIFATALASLFASVLMFYGILLFLLIAGFRFIFRMF